MFFKDLLPGEKFVDCVEVQNNPASLRVFERVYPNSIHFTIPIEFQGFISHVNDTMDWALEMKTGRVHLFLLVSKVLKLEM